MTLKIISAQEILFTGEVKAVTLPGTKGRFTVLHNHASLLSTLVAGSIAYTDNNDEEHAAEITGGIVDVSDNVISVCVY